METQTVKIPAVIVTMLTNWKTSIVGVAMLVLAYNQAHQIQNIWMTLHDPAFQTFMALGIFGLIAKDGNVSGGTVGSTPEARSRIIADSAARKINLNG